MRYKYLTETQREKLEFLTPEEADEIQQTYLDNDMRELKKICKTLIYKKKKSSQDLPTLHDAELESLAVEVFLSSLLKYNSDVKCTFKTYLYGNIWRKYWTYTRDIERKNAVFLFQILTKRLESRNSIKMVILKRNLCLIFPFILKLTKMECSSGRHLYLGKPWKMSSFKMIKKCLH